MGRRDKRDSMSEEEQLLQALSASPAVPEKPAKSPPREAASEPPQVTSRRRRKNATRGRVDIIRQTAHRGGKAVTVVQNFKGIGLPEKQQLAKKMQRACGVGGTVKDGRIEIQGDQRDEVKRILTDAGFDPVFAGG